VSGGDRGCRCASGGDREADACPTSLGEADARVAVVGKGGEVGSKPAGRRSASGRASNRRLLMAGGRRPLWLDRC
jgi:hypothetical protein